MVRWTLKNYFNIPNVNDLITIINEFAVCCFTSLISVALVNIILVRSQELGPGFNSHPVARRVVLCRLNYISCRGFSQKWSLGLFRGKGMRLLWIYRRDVVVKLQWNSWSSALAFLIKFTWGSLTESLASVRRIIGNYAARMTWQKGKRPSAFH